MLPRATNGIHAPNLRTWNLLRMLQAITPTGAVTLLHHQLFERDEWTGQGGDVENVYWYGPLRHGRDPARHGGDRWPARPEMLIHIRAYDAHRWREMNPEDWGRHIARKGMRWTGHNYPETNLWDDPFVVWTLCNEQNIEGWVVSSLGGERERTEAYNTIGRWQLVAMQALDDELVRHGVTRRALLGWGALAFGHDMIPGVPDSEYQNPHVRRAIEYADVLTAHPYGARHRPETWSGSVHKDALFFMDRPFRQAGVDGHPLGGCSVQYPHKPLLITEVGTFSHDTLPRESAAALAAHWRLAAASGRCIGSTAYMWEAGDEHLANSIRDAGMQSDLAALGPILTAATLPAAQPGGAGRPAPAPDPVPPPAPEEPVETMNGVKIYERASAHYSARRGHGVRYVVIHSTFSPEGATPASTLRFLQQNERGVSVHEYIPEPGMSWRMVDDARAAHHAETESARWPDGTDWRLSNEISWGMEAFQIQWEPLGSEMVETMAQRAAAACSRFGLGADAVLMHREIDPGRRSDPVGVDADAFRARVAQLLEPAQDVAAAIRAWADGAQVIEPNEGAGLYKRIRTDGFWPISDEDRPPGTELLVTQLARELLGEAERIYVWDERTGRVRWIERRPR